MMEPIIKIFPDSDQLTDFFILRIAGQISAKSSGQYFSIALSGGSTPKAIFKLIAEKYQSRIDWRKVVFFWGMNAACRQRIPKAITG
jgi:6-phosphogluconolactonase